MEKQFDDAGRALLGEVLRAQALHSADECIGIAGHVQRVAIRTALMGARHGIHQRQQQERHRTAGEDENRESSDVGLAGKPEVADRHIEHAIGDEQAECEQRFERDALQMS